MTAFPNWGAIVANTINSLNNKQDELVGDYVKERATVKDKLIGYGILIGITVFILAIFIIVLWVTN
jgi:t-SNARE complex subunit (syntaxin)